MPTHHSDGDRRRGWPTHLFWGRMRTSTFVLIVAFLATWWIYETYKPAPLPVAPETQVVPPGFVPDPSYTWVPRTRVPTTTPTTTPPTTTTTTPETTPETTTTPTEPTPSTPLAPGQTPPASGEPTTVGPGSMPTTTPTIPTPLTPGQAPATTAENRSGRPTPTTAVGVPVPGNSDRP